MSCETPLKCKEVTSLGKKQPELTAQIDRLSIVCSQKHEAVECRISTLRQTGHIPLLTAELSLHREVQRDSRQQAAVTLTLSQVSDSLRTEQITRSSNLLNFRDS